MATWALLLAAFGFLGYTAATQWEELRAHPWEMDPLRMAASVVAHLLVLCWGVYLWSRVLRQFVDAPPPFPALLRVWAYSNAARYIPGTVWQFVTAAQLSRDVGMGRVLALSSMLVHVAFSLLSAVVLSVLVLPLEPLGLPAGVGAALRVALPLAALAAVHPAVLNGALGVLRRVVRREVTAWRGGWGAGVWLLLLAHLSWMLYGVAYFLFVAALTPVPLDALPALTAVNALSFVAGYLVVFAPGGLGVRESAMSLLLTPLIPAAVAVVLAVLARLWSIAAEVLLALLGAAWARRAAR